MYLSPDVKAAFNRLQRVLHEQAKSKGFWDAPPPSAPSVTTRVLEKLMLVTTELAEAAEEVRKPGWLERGTYYREDGKPEGIAMELADAMIRLFDLAEYLGVSLIDAIAEKDDFNRNRPHMHGKTA